MSLKPASPEELRRQARHRIITAAAECARQEPLRAFHVLLEREQRLFGRRDLFLALADAEERIRLLAIDLRAVFDDLKDQPEGRT